MTKRPFISLQTKLACALSELEALRARVYLQPAMAFRDMQQISAADFVARYDFHHVVPHAMGGGIHFSNLTPMLRADHRAQTAKRDIPAIAKSKRLAKAQAAHREVLARKGLVPVDVTGERADAPTPPRKRKWPKRKWPKQRVRR